MVPFGTIDFEDWDWLDTAPLNPTVETPQCSGKSLKLFMIIIFLCIKKIQKRAKVSMARTDIRCDRKSWLLAESERKL
jgi:hypothetical protein